MIPKVINYCWFGPAPIPNIVKKCIASWKEQCPDYKIQLWNEDNYDVNKILYTKECYKNKKYAFLTDYARLDILYHNGGIYLDTDVFLLKSLTPLLNNGAFMAFEKKGRVATGLGMACEAGNPIVKENMKYYEDNNFFNKNGDFVPPICVPVTTKLLISRGLKYRENKVQHLKDMTIYSSDYLAPKKMGTNKLNITDNTYGVHLYASSWYKGNKFVKKIKYRLIPLKEFIKYKILRRKLYE